MMLFSSVNTVSSLATGSMKVWELVQNPKEKAAKTSKARKAKDAPKGKSLDDYFIKTHK
jgi:hypothetical protein